MAEITSEQKVQTFKEELDIIYDKDIKYFTEICLITAPDYFYLDCPASSSGKYHNISELGVDGCILHTKKVCTVAFEMVRGLGCEPNRDSVISACLIHDLRKQGITKTGHTVKNHPDLAAKLVQEVQNDTGILKEKEYSIIRNSVGHHYGPWSQNPWKKPLSDFSPEEMCVYLSDYVASRKTVSVEHQDRF